MNLAFAATLAVALSSSQATAQGISLHPGETVTVRIENGQAVVGQTSPAGPMSRFEAYMLAQKPRRSRLESRSCLPASFSTAKGRPTPRNRMVISCNSQ